MTAEYWFHIDGDNLGPLNGPAIDDLIRRGVVRAETWTWHPGREDWAPAGRMPEFLEAHPLLAANGAAAALAPAPAIAAKDARAAPESEPQSAAAAVPKGMGLGLELAGLRERLLAGAIDTLFLFVLSVGLLHASGEGAALFDFELAPSARLETLLPAWHLGIYAAYFLFFMSFLGGGQTLGYRALELQLVDQETERPPGLFPAALWYLGTFVLFAGWVWFFFDPRRRMLHNLVSRTLVIYRTDTS